MRGVYRETGASRTLLEGFVVYDCIILDADYPFELYIFTIIELCKPPIAADSLFDFLNREPTVREYKDGHFCCSFVSAMFKAAENVVVRSSLRSGNLTL